ncbi:MAG: hypothetical protein JXP34_24920, partial [Planctomycetes bacterium]|nr:hypothetical protein [Planctomycetota bacterium]
METKTIELDNGIIAAVFEGGRLVRIRVASLGLDLAIEDEAGAIAWDGETFDLAAQVFAGARATAETIEIRYAARGSAVRVIYELKPGRRFIAKRIVLDLPAGATARVDSVEVLRGRIRAPLAGEHRIGGGSRGVFLRFAGTGEEGRPGAFLVLQNPFMKWERKDERISMTYAPDMEWKAEYGPFESDRACIGFYRESGVRFPAQNLPEWTYVPEPEKTFEGKPAIDLAEVEALSGCVDAFVLRPPERSVKIHVPWCENDYQIDIGTAEGRAEYERIIDRAAEMGCEHMLFTPANREVSRLEDNTDAWGWENVLWLGLGQKIRTGEWDPERDAVPPSIQALLDHGEARGIRFVAYVYPSLGFLQDPEWTRWAGGKTGGYVGCDTGVRSFQDWLVGKLVAFANKTGASGFCFDHWWIAYDKASSKYAQWYGCRRILEELRRRMPDVVIDGRQQYQWFGPWTWVGGSYPHPTTNDEQAGSFENFPDLHFDRVSADRQRWAAWWYRMEQFCPTDLLPGYMTHQSQRFDAKGVCRKDRFHARDWDLLGWKYSVISSIGTAPIHNVVDMIPARDEDEFRLFPAEDAAWMRAWLAWTDANIDLLRRIRPIIGPPVLGRADGTAAIDGDRGFLFLFNPNYRALDAEFVLDGSIGISRGDRFLLREMHPIEGRFIGKPGAGVWSRGDRVSIRIKGPQAMALEVVPEAAVLRPAVIGACGRAAIEDGALRLTGVRGEEGTRQETAVLLPAGAEVRSVTVNGAAIPDPRRSGDIVSFDLGFAGV